MIYSNYLFTDLWSQFQDHLCVRMVAKAISEAKSRVSALLHLRNRGEDEAKQSGKLFGNDKTADCNCK